MRSVLKALFELAHYPPEPTRPVDPLVPIDIYQVERALNGLGSPLKAPDPAPSTSDRGQEHASMGKEGLV